MTDTNRSAIGLILDEASRILTVTNRKYNCWGLPGGKVEEGETDERACRREILEEVNLVVSPVALYSIYTGTSQTGRRVRVFWVTEARGEPQAMEAGTDIRWQSLRELLDSGTVFRSFYIQALMNNIDRCSPTRFLG